MGLGADSVRLRTKKQGTDWCDDKAIKPTRFVHTGFSAWKHRTMAGQQQTPQDSGEQWVQSHGGQLPPRRDQTVLSDSIPLFFVGRNRSGFWVARESQGRCGGLFLFKDSAVRFARKKSSPRGCATMLVERTIELNVPNQGNRLVEPIGTIIDVVRRRAPLVTTFIGMAIAAWRKLDALISHVLADHGRSREAIENDLFRGEYKLVSKSDDDLPILTNQETCNEKRNGKRASVVLVSLHDRSR
jgi:hypothetical protein